MYPHWNACSLWVRIISFSLCSNVEWGVIIFSKHSPWQPFTYSKSITWNVLFVIAFRAHSISVNMLNGGKSPSTEEKIILRNSQDSPQGWQITWTNWTGLLLSVASNIVSEYNFKQVPSIFWAMMAFSEYLRLPKATLKGIYLDANTLTDIPFF